MSNSRCRRHRTLFQNIRDPNFKVPSTEHQTPGFLLWNIRVPRLFIRVPATRNSRVSAYRTLDYSVPAILLQINCFHAKEPASKPLVSETEPHDLLQTPCFLLQRPTVPLTEPHWFLQQSHMVPPTEPHGSCSRATWFVKQRHMVPAKDPMVPAT